MTNIYIVRDNITGKKISGDYYEVRLITTSIHSGQKMHSTFHTVELDHVIGILKAAKNVNEATVQFKESH